MLFIEKQWARKWSRRRYACLVSLIDLLAKYSSYAPRTRYQHYLIIPPGTNLNNSNTAKPEQKWSAFRRRHFQLHLLERTFCILISLIFFLRIQCPLVSIDSGNGLAPDRRQATTWNNDDQSLEFYMPSSGRHEFGMVLFYWSIGFKLQPPTYGYLC